MKLVDLSNLYSTKTYYTQCEPFNNPCVVDLLPYGVSVCIPPGQWYITYSSIYIFHIYNMTFSGPIL